MINPGKAIDALKDDIRKSQKDGKECVVGTEKASEEILKTKVLTSDLLIKTQGALKDKQELYRDLATFEFNYSKKNKREFFLRLEDMHGRIEQLREVLAAMDPEEVESGWLSESQLDEMTEAVYMMAKCKSHETARLERLRTKFSLVYVPEDTSKSVLRRQLTKALSVAPPVRK